MRGRSPYCHVLFLNGRVIVGIVFVIIVGIKTVTVNAQLNSRYIVINYNIL